MTPAEEIFSLHLPDEPQSMEVEIRLEGVIEPDRLERAISAALDTHPMSRARLVSGRFLLRAPRWVVVDSGSLNAHVLQCVTLGDEEILSTTRDDFCSLRPDLDNPPAIRVLHVRRTGGDSLLFNIHHSLMDGIGAIRWVNSVARNYAGRPDPVPEVDPLAARDLFAMVGDRVARSQIDIPAKVPRGSVSGVRKSTQDDRAGYGIIHRILEADRCAKLNPTHFGPDTTVNDLLVAGVHRTIEVWNRAQGGQTDWTSVMVPVNLRPASWSNEVAVGLSFVDRNVASPSDRADGASLVETVTAQMKRVRSGPGFARLMNRGPWTRWLIGNAILPMILYTPRAVPRFVKGPVDSMLFANLGRIESKISAFGGLAGRLTEFWASPPVTMPLGAGLDSAFLRGDLFLSLRYRRALMDRSSADEFMTTFVQVLLDLGRVEV